MTYEYVHNWLGEVLQLRQLLVWSPNEGINQFDIMHTQKSTWKSPARKTAAIKCQMRAQIPTLPHYIFLLFNSRAVFRVRVNYSGWTGPHSRLKLISNTRFLVHALCAVMEVEVTAKRRFLEENQRKLTHIRNAIVEAQWSDTKIALHISGIRFWFLYRFHVISIT